MSRHPASCLAPIPAFQTGNVLASRFILLVLAARIACTVYLRVQPAIDLGFAEAPELANPNTGHSARASHLLHGLGMKTKQLANFVGINEWLEFVVHYRSPIRIARHGRFVRIHRDSGFGHGLR